MGVFYKLFFLKDNYYIILNQLNNEKTLLTDSGFYNNALQTSHGCDSVIITRLTMITYVTQPGTTLTADAEDISYQLSLVKWMIFLCLAGLNFSVSLFATTYYVKNGGNNDASGTTPEQAWETIGRINNQNFDPGDSILFHRGDVWRNEELRVSSSGDINNHIIFGAYGSGVKPQILGSVQAINWTKVSDNIWSSATSIPEDPWTIGYDGPEIFFEEKDETVTWGVHQKDTTDFYYLTEEYDWTWRDNSIYIYSSTDPNSRYNSVEIPQLAKGVYLLDHNYITIDGLELKYYGDAAIYDQYATIQLYGLHVTNCRICYIGRKEGGAAYGLSVHHSDSYYAYNEIYNCGRRGISLTLYDTDPITQSNVIIEHNHFHHGWHTTSLDCSTISGHTIENIVFRNNFVEGSPYIQLGGINPNSNHVYVSESPSGSGTVQNIWFYNNIFTYAHASSIKVTNVDNAHIYNNTFYYFNPTLTNWQAHVFCSKSTNVSIMNNIFCNNATDNHWAAIECHTSVVDQYQVDYNLYYNTDPSRRMFWIDDGISYDVEEWNEYRTATGNDANSPDPADPQFINPPSDFYLGDNSPAKGKGIAIDEISSDYYRNAINNPPDLGAIQYGSRPLNIPLPTQNNSIHIYPNPVKDICNVVIRNIGEEYFIRIFNLQGKKVYESRKKAGTGRLAVPLTGFSSGIYFLQITNNNNFTETRKLVKYSD